MVEYLKTPVLLSIVELVMVLSVGFYLAIYGFQSEASHLNLGFAAATLLFGTTRTLQLYLKVILAEGIYKEVYTDGSIYSFLNCIQWGFEYGSANRSISCMKVSQ